MMKTCSENKVRAEQRHAPDGLQPPVMPAVRLKMKTIRIKFIILLLLVMIARVTQAAEFQNAYH